MIEQRVEVVARGPVAGVGTAAWTGAGGMRLRLTVQVRTSGSPVASAELEVRAGLGTRLGDVRAALLTAAGIPTAGATNADPRTAVLVADGMPLDASHVLGMPPLLQGAVVTVAGPRSGSGLPRTAGHPRPPAPTAQGAPRAATPAGRPDGRGHLLLHPGPRLTASPAGTSATGSDVTLPDPPPAPAVGRPSFLVLAAPVLLALPLALVWRQPTVLLVAAVSPVVGLAQHVGERRSRRREHARASARHEHAVATLERDVADRLDGDLTRAREQHPDLAAVARATVGPGSRLWERGPADEAARVLRLGTGEVPSTIRVRASGPAVEVRAGPPAPRLLAHAPVPLDLGRLRVVGLTGDRQAAMGAARALLLQAAAWHSPRHLRIALPPHPDWAWARWLPHTCAPDPVDRWTLAVLDGPAGWRGGHEVRLPDDHAAICIAPATRDLPPECAAVVEFQGRARPGSGPGTPVAARVGETAVLRVRGQAPQQVRADLAPIAWSERVARRLAPLRDARPGSGSGGTGLPALVGLATVLRAAGGPDLWNPGTLVEVWQAGRTRTDVPLGMTCDGPWQVDLRADGPHVLLAGTTGSGKSELLTCLVLGLGALNPPDRMAFVLVDYKGGSAFAELADLPHVAGVVTDLDGPRSRRVLASLQAELRRRERVLRSAGVPDLDDCPDGVGRPPRLVLVVDEFRVLAEDQPDLLAGLVRIAAVGRSLGVHLVLATQRPGGVVSPDIRANVNLRIALRVRDRADSEDVVGAQDAADLPVALPGRGVARTGGGPLVVFQAATARVAGADGRPLEPEPDADAAARARSSRPEVRRLPPGTGLWPVEAATAHSVAAPPRPGTGSAVAAAVDAVVAAADQAGVRPPPPPWLPPLPALVLPGDLPAEDVPCEDQPDAAGPRTRQIAPGRSAPRLVYAVADLPEDQRRGCLAWDLGRDGTLAVVGAPGSGRTSVLRALARAGALDARVHVHRIRAGPDRDDAVPATDVERSDLLLALLHEAARTGAPAGDDLRPWHVLLVDGWEAVAEAWAPVDGGRLVDDLLRLARDGVGSRVRVAVAGGRAVLAGALGAVVSTRVLLRPADPADLILAGIPARQAPGEMPPGRVLHLRPPAPATLGQVLLLDSDGAGDAQEAALVRAVRSGPARSAPPVRIPALPQSVPAEALEQLCRSGAAGHLVPVGIGRTGAGGPDRGVGPTGLALTDGPVALVVGPPGSGRSSVLVLLARLLAAGGHGVVLVSDADEVAAAGVAPADADGPVGWASPAGGMTILAIPDVATAPQELGAALARRPDTVLLADDAEGWLHGPVEDLVLAHLSGSRSQGARGATAPPNAAPNAAPLGTGTAGPPALRAVVATTTQDALVAYRGVIAIARRARTGLLLGRAAAGDGAVLGIRPVVGGEAPPGRALLVRRGRAVPVQVAHWR